MDTKFEFNLLKANLIQARRELLVLLPNQAQNYFVRSFKSQSWNGVAWKEVQRRMEGTSAYKYPKTKGLQRRTSPILVGAGWKIRGGALRRAVSNMARTVETSADRFRMIIDLPYAEIHNEGGQGKAFGKYSFTMPKRQFVGQTQTLTDMQRYKIDQIVTKVFKK
jgi:phage gpG-like protein